MEIKIFESKVDVIKYKVLRELAKQRWEEVDHFVAFNDVANEVLNKDEPPMRCCIYKDRAVVAERMRIAMGNYHNQEGVVQVVSIACDECPKSGHMITDICRGCVAHNCREACRRNAIYIDEKGYAHINKDQCVECGMCRNACKYGAIINMVRPCEKVCPTGAISMGPTGAAVIDHSKCINCGECVFTCPFGATNDLSQMMEVIDAIKNKKEGEKLYAVVAPAVAVQFPNVTTNQVYATIKELGFDEIYEAAESADYVASIEANELLEKGFLTSSCCPGFVEYVHNEFPELVEHVSSTPSPMVLAGQIIKKKDPKAKVCFIGPCIAKKSERKSERAGDAIDMVLTFFELYALAESKGINAKTMPELEMTKSSPYGRAFCQSGGVTAAVVEYLEETGKGTEGLKPVVCNGIAECKKALMMAKAGKLNGNFIEGMCCEGGCVRGKGTLKNKPNSPAAVKKFMSEAGKKTISEITMED